VHPPENPEDAQHRHCPTEDDKLQIAAYIAGGSKYVPLGDLGINYNTHGSRWRAQQRFRLASDLDEFITYITRSLGLYPRTRKVILEIDVFNSKTQTRSQRDVTIKCHMEGAAIIGYTLY
jgi:hypothetical protein